MSRTRTIQVKFIDITPPEIDHSRDAKDLEVIPEPPRFHTIVCKECNKKSKVKIKFTRKCNKCRHIENADDHFYEYQWQAWGNSPIYD